MILNYVPLNFAPLNSSFGVNTGPELIVKPDISTVLFTCTITGAPDIEIPISNISGELVADGVSSVSVVCPDGAGYAELINERLAGNLIINTIELYTDWTSAVISSDHYLISYIASDKGASAWSVSISGKITFPGSVAVKYEAIGTSYINSNIDGKRRIRLDYNSSLRVNDILIVHGSEMIIGRISYVISRAGSYMYCSEL